VTADYYPRSQIMAFVGLPLLIMVPVWAQIMAVFVIAWLACLTDFLGWRVRRRARP